MSHGKSTIVTRLRSKSNQSSPGENTPPHNTSDSEHYSGTAGNSSKRRKRRRKSKETTNMGSPGQNGQQHEEQNKNGVGDTTPKEPESNLLQTITSLSTTLATLQTEINTLKTAKGQFDSLFTEEWKQQVDGYVTQSQMTWVSHEFRLNLLTNIAIKQEQRIDMLEEELSQAYKREIKANMVISGIIEEPNETRALLIEKVGTFFKEKMLIETDIEVTKAYHKGKGKDRPIPFCVEKH